MIDEILMNLAKSEKWTPRDVNHIRDNAYALMQARALLSNAAGIRERMQEELYASRPAKLLYAEIETYAHGIEHNAESVIRQKGADPGHSGAEALRLWQQASELVYLVPSDVEGESR